jgi:hypothetical protein
MQAKALRVRAATAGYYFAFQSVSHVRTTFLKFSFCIRISTDVLYLVALKGAKYCGKYNQSYYDLSKKSCEKSGW